MNTEKACQFESAVYKKQIIAEFRNNPLIEALPNLCSIKDMLKKMVLIPKYKSSERNLEDYIRLHKLDNLRGIIIPLSKHKEIGLNISSVLRHGYITRNPLDPENVRKLNMLSEIFKDGSIRNNLDNYKIYNFQTNQSAMGFAIIGLSGVGKSKAVERALASYPQVIYHEKYREKNFTHTQIVWLKLDCPAKGSPNGLCINFFGAIDSILGTDFTEKMLRRRATVETMMYYMSKLAVQFSVGLIVIDELQHLLESRTDADVILNFLVTLDNIVGVPLVLIGNYTSLDVLQRSFRQARRASGSGEVFWNRMDNDVEWKTFLTYIWKYQWTKYECELTQEIVDTMHEETMGIAALTIGLYKAVQRRAILSGKEIITPELIKIVSNEEKVMTKPMRDALKSKLYSEYEFYRDLHEKDGDAFAYNQKHKDTIIKEKKKRKKPVQLQDNEEVELAFNKIYLWLLEKDIESDKAKERADEIVNNYNLNTPIEELQNLALKGLIKEKISKLEKQKKAKSMEEGDLRKMYKEKEQSGSDMHSVLEENNLIKSPDELLKGVEQ